MSKRKVKFAEDPVSGKEADEPSTRRFKEENTIESDEELEEAKADDHGTNSASNILTEDDIEGQEDETIKSYGEIKVTPFNLKEEMEEGHFDSEGNYIADKDAESFKDEWLESVDWAKVDEEEDQQAENWEDEPEKLPASEKLAMMKGVISLLKPGENILKALRRFGGRNFDRKQKGSNKNGSKDETKDESKDEDKNKLLKLTEFADSLLQQGDFEIYSKTFERLNVEVKREEEKFKDADDDDDELEKAFAQSSKESEDKKVEEKLPESDEVMWEYKWDQSNDAQLYGPYSNSCMISWKEQGFFKDGVFCRKVGSNGSFYNSKRLDFELYD